MAEVAREQGLSIPLFAEEAAEGTDLHALVDPTKTIPDTLSEEQRGIVERCRAYVKLHSEGAVAIYYEEHMGWWRKDVADGDPLNFGTPDVVIVFPDHVHVIDFKMGWMEVRLEEVEWQLRNYAGLAMYSHFRARAKVSVYQPRLGFEATAEYADWRAIRDQVEAVLARVKAEPETRVVGAHCRYCPAQTACTEFQGLVGEAQLPEKASGSFQVAPAALARYLDLAALVAPWADRVRDYAKEQIIAGVDVPGWEVVTKMINRKASPAKPASTQEQKSLRRRSHG